MNQEAVHINPNSTYFTLSLYFETGIFKYVFFVVVLCLYVSILGANLLLVAVVCLNRTLHKPMYIFLCSLFMNEVCGSTSLFPSLLVQILRDVHVIPASLCFLQNFLLFLYGACEFQNLAVMSYDRYVAICCPLEYNARMTPNRIAFLIALTWVCPLFLCIIMTSLSTSLQLCGNIIQKIYCDNYSVVKLACSDTTINNIYGVVITCLSVFVPLIVIFHSYFHILKVCFTGSKQTRRKAVSTCSPHIASLLNFSCGACFEVFQSRFNMRYLPTVLRILLSLYWLTSQPLFNPVLYGLNTSKIRIICKSLFFTSV